MPAKKTAEIDYSKVAQRAYELWEERGQPHGGHDDDWYRAEQELRAAPKSPNGNGVKKTPKAAPKKPKASAKKTTA
jgi:Protein of unknown function (DUF2934)